MLFFMVIALKSNSQYFGKNKVSYEDFAFKIFDTDHFQIYNYLQNQEKIYDIGQLAERWYQRHQAVFLDTLKEDSPIILYNNHSDFQQTTVISSIIGVGTGGVTESMRNRIVMPVMKSNSETDHVLGHELVHVFQYHMFKNTDSVNFREIGNIPLWMIEGLAEYMSIGTSDAQTAMWMRDAVMNDDIPTLKEMTRRPDKYFPYRYGHAWWSFMASRWGDRVIRPILLSSAAIGYRAAIDSVLGLNTDTLSILWKEDLIKTHQPYIKANSDEYRGEKLFGTPDAMNIAPAVSPDGRYVIFLADRDVITIDFYLADIRKKKIIKRLTREIRDTHIDDYSYTESVGTWSPDSKRFALSMFADGRKKLLIFDVNGRSPKQIIEIDTLDYFDNPSWSPDGSSILLSGLQDGQSDLYLYYLDSGELRQLTNDYYSDLQPAWAPDGKKLVFISDRGNTTNLDRLAYGNLRLCEYYPDDGSIDILQVFPGVDSYSPQYDSTGNKIYFISAANGIQNIYELNTGEEKLYRLSDFSTGVSSISGSAPALSSARNKNLLVYVHYEKRGYSIYKASPADFAHQEMNPMQFNLAATNLVSKDEPEVPTVVDINMHRYPLEDPSTFARKPYIPAFALEAIGSVGVGVGFDQTNTAAAGGVSFLFSDMLKRNQLYLAARVNQRLIDAGGQLVYFNQKKRLNWGVSLSHFPSLSIMPFTRRDTIESTPVIELVHMERRIFRDELGIFGVFPLSKKIRFEAGLNGSLYSFRLDSTNYIYTENGLYLGTDKNRLDAPDPYWLFSGYLAYVGDNTYFGLTSPLRGHRYRFQIGTTQGRISYYELLGDFRDYYFFKPVGLAYRITHYGRYGSDARDFYPFYLGYPYYVRGYSYNSLINRRCPDNECLGVDQITGSKMLIAGFETRLPLTGPKRLALIRSGFLFSDLVLFLDTGLAWDSFDDISFSFNTSGQKHIPIFSTGASIRINLFGMLILEPYYAFPLQMESYKNGHFGFYISAGGW